MVAAAGGGGRWALGQATLPSHSGAPAWPAADPCNIKSETSRARGAPWAACAGETEAPQESPARSHCGQPHERGLFCSPIFFPGAQDVPSAPNMKAGPAALRLSGTLAMRSRLGFPLPLPAAFQGSKEAIPNVRLTSPPPASLPDVRADHAWWEHALGGQSTWFLSQTKH